MFKLLQIQLVQILLIKTVLNLSICININDHDKIIDQVKLFSCIYLHKAFLF